MPNEVTFPPRLAAALLIALSAAVPSAGSAAHGQERPAPEQNVFAFHKISENVYHAIGTGRMMVVSNAAVIINEADVLVVDSHISPAAASALLTELRRITPKPVRYVVNTHFHFDHSHGNQAYPPGVEIIGHEFTREMMAAGKSMSGAAYEAIVGSIPQRIEQLKRDIANASDAQQRARLEGQLVLQQDLLLATRAVRPTPPTTTLASRMTLHRGDRAIQLVFFGRGHTGGDVVVYLPQEKVLVTGDLLLEGVPYMGDAFPVEWVETLEQVKQLDFDVVMPGHGNAFRGKEKIAHLQSYLRDFWQRASDHYARGTPAEAAARQIDMRDHAAHYPRIQEVGVPAAAVGRAYALLKQLSARP